MSPPPPPHPAGSLPTQQHPAWGGRAPRRYSPAARAGRCFPAKGGVRGVCVGGGVPAPMAPPDRKTPGGVLCLAGTGATRRGIARRYRRCQQCFSPSAHRHRHPAPLNPPGGPPTHPLPAAPMGCLWGRSVPSVPITTHHSQQRSPHPTLLPAALPATAPQLPHNHPMGSRCCLHPGSPYNLLHRRAAVRCPHGHPMSSPCCLHPYSPYNRHPEPPSHTTTATEPLCHGPMATP